MKIVIIINDITEEELEAFKKECKISAQSILNVNNVNLNDLYRKLYEEIVRNQILLNQRS